MPTVEGLPPEILKFLIYLLAVAFSTTGVTLLGVLGFLARGVLARLNRMESTNNDQFATFGRQLAALRSSFEGDLKVVHDLVLKDIHQHDVRITKLEEWRKGVDRTRGNIVAESD